MQELQTTTNYSQRDQRWANILLGNNTDIQFTIGFFGCLLTTLVNYLNAIGKTETPDSLNTKLKENGGFGENDGNLVWTAVANIYSEVKPDYISQRYVDAPVPDTELANMRNLIDKGFLLFLEIDFYPNQAGEQMHWVLCYGYSDNGDFLIIDPWTGTKTVLSVYGAIATVLIGYRSYNITVPVAEPMVCDPKSVRDMLVTKATQRDDVWGYLELDLDPSVTPSSKVVNTIAGYKSVITATQSQDAKDEAQVENLTEQLAHAQATLLQEQQLRIGLTQQLNQDADKIKNITGLYEGQMTNLKGVNAQLLQDKADLNITLKIANAQISTLKSNFLKAVGLKDILALFLQKLLG